MRLLLWSSFIIAAWKWGDWRNWKKYEGAIYYNIIFSYIYTLLTIQYPMWTFEKDSWLPFLSNHVLISIFYGPVIFTSTNLIYLGRFPKGKWKGVLWVLLFVSLMSIIEYLLVEHGRMQYHHGWKSEHSVLFNGLMFSAVRLYMNRPIVTLVLSVIVVIIYIFTFNIPINELP